ncbi:hypothetical protein KR018_008443 [Drosophila ironensis]|nr:hypothetical protein KR018_008443 [Drosophila ironensis]
MASCDVPPTASQEELKQKETIKNVKNSEERDQAKLSSSNAITSDKDAHSGEQVNPQADMNASVSAVVDSTRPSQADARPTGSRSRMTRIPGPVLPGPSGSLIQTSRRQYSSVLRMAKSNTSMSNASQKEREPAAVGNQQPASATSSRLDTANDSGIHMEESAIDLEPSCSKDAAPKRKSVFDAIPKTQSELDMDRAQEQTLRELQRVVAEMEADVAQNDQEESELQFQDSIPEIIIQEAECTEDQLPYPIPVNRDTTVYAELKSLDESDNEQSSDQKEEGASEDDCEKQVPDLTTQDEEVSKSSVQEPSVEEPPNITQFPRAQTLLGELEMAISTAPMEAMPEAMPEAMTEAMTEAMPDAKPEAMPEAMPEAKLEAIMEETEAMPEAAPEATPEAIREATPEAKPEAEPTEISDEMLTNTSDVALVDRTTPVCSHVDGNDRRMVRMEELFDSEHNVVELLRQMLQAGAEAYETESTETEADTKETESSDDDDEQDTEDEEDITTEDKDEAIFPATSEVRKPSSFLYSMVQRFTSHKMAHLSYPLLFCGLAFSLIYLSRKV